ncbi:hypothetical protein GCM10009681_35670 [Luedemannella helvata]|uniref:CDP-Glycerol:Poly(Glycerophosphate) glycerophosphotransferase n=1 Tax=Luedemannella helvata TaxID=349315 RepID=A0ABP4WU29_9ACTN
MAAAGPVLYLAALLPAPVLFAVAMAAAFAGEVLLPRHAPRLSARLNRAGLGTTTRGLLRDGALPLLLLREGGYSATTVVVVSVLLLVVSGLRGAACAALRALATLRRLPMPTRNLDLSALRLPGAPPRWLPPGDSHALKLLSAPAVAGVLIDLFTGGRAATVAGFAVSLAAGAVLLTAAGIQLLRHRVLADTRRLRAEVLRQVRAYRPEVILYFSMGPGANTTYQVDTWLDTLAGLDRRTMILVRERPNVMRIGATALPIVCVPGGPDVMDLDLPDLRVVLYPGNAGKNIHMLRRNGVRHVFIAHGDSDKSASTNPFTRAYDEVWVAGPAGRDRYRDAGGAVRDESIVEVGRPQVDAVHTGQPAGPFTVLYAPTWEGWADDLAVSSLVAMGPDIVRALLALDPEVRVIYKPHPLTGYLDPAARRAHQAIVGLLANDTDARAADPARVAVIAAEEPARAAARQRLDSLGRLLAEGPVRGPWSDNTAHALAHGRPDPKRLAALVAAQRARCAAFWASEGSWAHRVVTGPWPDLYSCFNEAHLMIADVSAVVSDFLAADRPYVVCDPGGGDEAAFRQRHTAARGGHVLTPAGIGGLADLVNAARTPGGDVLAAQRAATRAYLLGPDSPSAMTRWRSALEALIARPYGRTGLNGSRTSWAEKDRQGDAKVTFTFS